MIFRRLLAERAVRAFIGASLAAVAAGMAMTDFSVPSIKALLIGAGAAGVSAVLSLVSQFVGDPNSTSLLPSVKVENTK
jgi:malic enzyme